MENFYITLKILMEFQERMKKIEIRETILPLVLDFKFKNSASYLYIPLIIEIYFNYYILNNNY